MRESEGKLLAELVVVLMGNGSPIFNGLSTQSPVTCHVAEWDNVCCVAYHYVLDLVSVIGILVGQCPDFFLVESEKLIHTHDSLLGERKAQR